MHLVKIQKLVPNAWFIYLFKKKIFFHDCQNLLLEIHFYEIKNCLFNKIINSNIDNFIKSLFEMKIIQ